MAPIPEGWSRRNVLYGVAALAAAVPLSTSCTRGAAPAADTSPIQGEPTMEFVTPKPTGKGPAEWFNGDVWFDVIHAGKEPSRIRANMVRFAPGARTAWHHHAVGQTLHITAGIALIGTRDGTVYEAHPGETVTCPPGEEHWHGATEDNFMQHLALWDAVAPDDDRDETTWLEHITDAQYNAKRTRSSH